jgi:hypothetical protein
LDSARAVADAVLYEGYLLYPYRRSSQKNQVRWQFGVLAPAQWVTDNAIPDPGMSGAAESWFQRTDCLAEAPRDALVRIRLRFLQVQRKQCLETIASGTLRPVDELRETHSGVSELSIDEALPREIEAEFAVADLLGAGCEIPVWVPGASDDEPVLDTDGREVGHVRRSSWPVTARLTVAASPAEAPFPLLRLTVRVENTAVPDPPVAPRSQVLRQSLIAAHLLVGLSTGSFVSLLDPPVWATAAVATCRQEHVFPVLAGADDRADVVLASPIILYDHPKIAPESPGDLHDAAEIDEILSLRTLTLSDAEKREARATDPRAAAIVDRVDGMPPEMMAKLHGVLRQFHRTGAPDTDAVPPDELPWWDPRAEAAVDPSTDTVLIAGRRVGRGDRVRLRPRQHGSDAHDMFLAGRVAAVHAVLHDVDGSIRLAVTAVDDPAAELHEWYGRFFHFTPDEVEPVEDEDMTS